MESESTTQDDPVIINHFMPASEIITYLRDHGCRNITSELDTSSSSQYPVANGGLGDIYYAKLRNGSQVAIKTMRLQIDPTSEGTKHLKHAARELHTWAKCDHPNVLKLLGLAVFRDQIGMVSPWMGNGSLPSYLSREPNPDRLLICAQISDGLAYLHQCGIVHGDIKGLNVLVSTKGVPALADFGNAVGRDRSLLFTTTTSYTSISLRWAAPELLQGSTTHTMESDIYALGMTILETVTGKIPYVEKTDVAVISAVLARKELPMKPKDAMLLKNERGDILWALLVSCWSHEPNDRPNATKVASTMREISSGYLEQTEPNSENVKGTDMQLGQTKKTLAQGENYIPSSQSSQPPNTIELSSKQDSRLPDMDGPSGRMLFQDTPTSEHVSLISSIVDDDKESEDESGEEEEEAHSGEDEGEEEDAESSVKADGPGRAVTSGGKRSIKWIKGALIGSGSLGCVYLGMDAAQGLLMAVKQVELPTGSSQNEERKKAALAALEHEIELLKQLQHENIVQYLDSSIDTHHLNIFLEYVPGGSVATLLRDYGAFEEPLVRNWVRQILQGLSYLHERGIIHRDIKADNILVDNKGGIKISDFGISKKVEDNLLGGARIHQSSLQGSVFWMAPEVVKQTSYTYKADIWSVGCLVVEMLTGQHPWAQLTQMQAIFKIGSSAKPTIPPDITEEAKNFLNKTFELDYTIRPTAAELLNDPWLAQAAVKGPAEALSDVGDRKPVIVSLKDQSESKK
ncbi:ATP binding [Ceratobasidium sp. UAMH 11750]|nr:ATP binding [Ceratobasidium sp. UAMH 11750]